MSAAFADVQLRGLPSFQGQLYEGQTIRVDVMVRSAANLDVDPASITFASLDPEASDGADTLTWYRDDPESSDAALIRDSEGNWHVDLFLASPGDWQLRAAATGTDYAGAEECHFFVRDSDFFGN